MFISKTEKLSIITRLEILEDMVNTLSRERRQAIEKEQPIKKDRKKRFQTMESKAMQSERMREVWAYRRLAKAEKLAAA